MAGIHNCKKNGGACTASSSTPTSRRTHIGNEAAGGRPRRISIASRRRSVMKQSHRFRAPCVCWKYAMRKSPPELPYACQVQVRRIGESKTFWIYVLFKDGEQPSYVLHQIRKIVARSLQGNALCYFLNYCMLIRLKLGVS